MGDRRNHCPRGEAQGSVQCPSAFQNCESMMVSSIPVVHEHQRSSLRRVGKKCAKSFFSNQWGTILIEHFVVNVCKDILVAEDSVLGCITDLVEGARDDQCAQQQYCMLIEVESEIKTLGKLEVFREQDRVPVWMGLKDLIRRTSMIGNRWKKIWKDQ